MRKRDLSQRERQTVEDAITRMCRALGVSETDGDLRQAAWAEILSVYRDDPKGFQGNSMRGWRRAYDLAGDAILKEVRVCQRQFYGQVPLDGSAWKDSETTLLQLLHSPSGSFENGVFLRDYLSRQHPDVQRAARGLMEGETLGQLRGCYRWSWHHAYWAFNSLRAAMEEYQQI